MQTNQLRLILGNEPLRFVIPGKLANNYFTPRYSKKSKPFNLRVSIHPKKLDEEHKVYVEGIEQFSITINSPLYTYWFKYKNANAWFKLFIEDWRYLLRLNSPDFDPKHNLLFKHVVGLKDLINRYEVLNNGGLFYKKKRKNHPFVKSKGSWKYDRGTKKGNKYYFKEYPVKVKRKENVLELDEINHILHHTKRVIKRENRYPLFNVKERPKKEKDFYWRDKPEITQDADGNPLETHIYLPIISNKDKIELGQSNGPKEKGRYERRDDRHKVILRDPNAVYQTMIIQPTYEKTVYKKDKHNKEFVYRKKKTVYHDSVWDKNSVTKDGILNYITRTEHIEMVKKPNKRFNRSTKKIDMAKSILATDKYQINILVPDYEYVPMTFSSKKQPEIQTFLWPCGKPKMKKIYKGKHTKTVTIKEFSRITYKTIITKQYPQLKSLRRGIVKKNIEFIKQANKQPTKPE